MGKGTRRMQVIPEPAPNARTIYVAPESGPIFKSGGKLNYACGSCDATLLRNVSYGQINNIVFQCRCGTFNEIPATHHGH